MNRILVIGGLIALLVTGLMLSQAIAVRRAADAALAEERRHVESAQTALAAASERKDRARAKLEAGMLTGTREAIYSGAKKETVSAAPTGAPKQVGTSFAEAARKWAAEYDRPENQVRWFAQQRRSNQHRYEPMFRELQLNEAQRTEFIDNLARRDERHSDLNAAVQALREDPANLEISKLRGEIYSEAAKAQKALLGEAGYQRVQEFDRTAGLREAVGNMAGLAAVSGMALSPAQMDQLVRKLAEQSPEYSKGGRASLMDVNPAALPAVLAGVLTAEQQRLFATQEAPGGAGAIFHAQWNAALVQATKAERQKAQAKPAGP